MRKSIRRKAYSGLVFNIIFVSLLASMLASTLKLITEHYQNEMIHRASNYFGLVLVFPLVGFTLIFLLRKLVFHNKPNKGITEIYNTLENRKNELPFYKVLSHYANGFLTVIFGGSTGVEVSTVVATAAIGTNAYKKTGLAYKYKTEIVVAAVAAGVATLFGSPFAGLFFAVEAIARKVSNTVVISAVLAVIVASATTYLVGAEPLFVLHPKPWSLTALPYLVGLSIVAGLLSVYFTKVCLLIKRRFSMIKNNTYRIVLGAAIVGTAILFLPQLYGDSYHVVSGFLENTANITFSNSLGLLLLALIILKPLVASVTLGAGGDGGVFAPGMVIGALLGLLFAISCNHYLGTHLIVVNFMVIGMAAVLSGCIHAPLTAIALFTTLSGSTLLLIPIIMACLIAKYTAKSVYQYSVYSYKP
ncbi:chloride channel protein [Arcticibacter pallidicorallinus]|nr:chloride channel protein [Arcticibacter pallidicorallinus]